MEITVLLTGGTLGAIGALVIDLETFLEHREKDRSAKFDWGLAGYRALKGFLAGVLTASGASGLGLI